MEFHRKDTKAQGIQKDKLTVIFETFWTTPGLQMHLLCAFVSLR